jgi:hypothetical protein
MRAATQVVPTAHQRPCPAKINPIRSTAIVNRLTIFDPLWEARSSAQFQFARGMVLRCALDAAIECFTHALRLAPLDPRMIGVLTGTTSGPTSAVHSSFDSAKLTSSDGPKRRSGDVCGSAAVRG